MAGAVLKERSSKRTTIITARILDRLAGLVERGVEHYEVRSESLEGADAVHLVGAETGEARGAFRVTRAL